MPVGKKLSAERRKLGLSIADIERITRIRGRFIEALEEEDWAHLPAVPYVKGYIQGYAKAVGADPTPLLREYEHDISGAPAETERRPALERIPARTVVPRRFDMHSISSKAWIGTVVAVIAVLLAIWVISSLTGPEDTITPIAPSTSGTVESTATSSSASTSVGPGASVDTTGTSAQSGAFTLVVTAAEGESSWLKVTVDGEVVFEDTLAGGTSEEWTVTEEAVVRIGNPSVVAVTRDGENVTVPLGTGIAEVTLTAGASTNGE